MKIVLLSVSIAILGYFALQTLPDRREGPQLASNSLEPTASSQPHLDRPGATRTRH